MNPEYQIIAKLTPKHTVICLGPYKLYDPSLNLKNEIFVDTAWEVYRTNPGSLGNYIDYALDPKENSKTKLWIKFCYFRDPQLGESIVKKEISTLGMMRNCCQAYLIDTNNICLRENLWEKSNLGKYFRTEWIYKFLSGEIHLLSEMQAGLIKVYASLYISRKFGWI